MPFAGVETESMVRVALFGAGGHAREVLQLLRDINAVTAERSRFAIEGFVVDEQFDSPSSVNEVPVLGGPSWLATRPELQLIVAIGSPQGRRAVVQRLLAQGNGRFATAMHPSSLVGANVLIGEGSVVFAGAVLTTDIKVGSHVHINTGCSISHDCVLSDFVTLGPGVRLAGGVVLGEGVELGASVTAIPRSGVGEWSRVGAGAVITAELPSHILAVGVPARQVRPAKLANGF